jgi:hypothetical protein
VSIPKNQNVWNYVPPHRGAMLDGGSPSSLSNDNSVDGGWSDRSTLGSSTSGFVYCPEAPYDGDSYVRCDGEWRSLFEGAGAVDSFLGLIAKVNDLDQQVKALQVTVDNLQLSEDGWNEERVGSLENFEKECRNGDITYPKVISSGNIIAYTESE